MSKNNFLLLVVWNVALSALLGWALMRKGASNPGNPSAEELPGQDSSFKVSTMVTDTATLKDAHIAFFFMDSIRSSFEMVKESSARVKSYGQSMDSDLRNRFRAVAEKMRALEEKDQRYTTVAEKEEDQKQYEALQQTMQQLKAEQDRKQQDFDEMQMKALQEITLEIQNYLAEYNATHRFDFIFSIQDEGQIWVGNKGLDITADVVNGLNAKHREKKNAEVPAAK